MKLLLALTITYTTFLVGQTLVLAKPVPSKSTHQANVITSKQKVSFVPPPAPTTESAPGGRARGGARRGSCPSVQPELTALVPSTKNENITNVWSLTAQAHPTLMFYVPYTQSSAYPSEFVLQDADANIIYQQAIALPNQPGIISVSLPSNAPGLELNKSYRWFFSVYCDPQKQAPPIYTEGVIQRVNLTSTIAQKLQTASLLEQSTIYAENGIWQEALLTLAQLRQTQPSDKNIEQQWQNLLTSIRLDDIATQPLLSNQGSGN